MQCAGVNKRNSFISPMSEVEAAANNNDFMEIHCIAIKPKGGRTSSNVPVKDGLQMR